MKFFLKIFIISLTFFSCNNTSKNEIDVSTVDVNFEVKRFDEAFYNASEKTLFKVKKEYPLLFPASTSDSIWLLKINDKDEQELFQETQKLYKNFENQKERLTTLFKHIKYYNPTFKSPNIITMLTNIDYQNRVVYADSLLLISLDVYLGSSHRFYNDFPAYIKQNNTKSHLIVDVANKFIEKQIRENNTNFLSKIITEGKKMYLLDRYLPNVIGVEKMGYHLQKYNWAIANEEQVWKYFIENDLLYSSNPKLDKRFIDNAPFSKFYKSQDSNSPGRIGVFIGWQIVHSYMLKNDVSLQRLIEIDAQSLFNNSKYKPKR